MQKGKMVVWGGHTNNWEKREVKDKGEKVRYTHLNADFQRIARRDKRPVQRIARRDKRDKRPVQRNRWKQHNVKDCRSLQEN